MNYYSPDGKGGYIPPQGNYDKLVKNADLTYTLTQKDKTIYFFDISGRLQTITDRNGNQIKINYDSADLITSIQDAGGHAIVFSYDPKRRIKKISDGLREVNLRV